ncbi:MAG TPA: PQQ-binding-like beta-propeller repeat protein [Humisphaera sp.]
MTDSPFTSRTVPVSYQNPADAPRRPRLRGLPVLVIVALYWAGLFVARRLDLAQFHQFLAVLGLLVFLLLGVVAWWLCRRGVRWRDKGLVLGVGLVALGVGTGFLVHPSLMGPGFVLLALPYVLTVLAITGVIGARLPAGTGRWLALAAAAVVWAIFPLLRADGVDGQQRWGLHWRWTPTPEQQYLAERAAAGKATKAGDVVASPTDWPGFRGASRDGIARGVTPASTTWSAAVPTKLWRHKIGPGWSSMAVAAGRVYTQEQRGSAEAVVCLDADTGLEIWSHEDAARFEEALAGAGPRGTPTVDGGKVYAQGATGLLNCLDAATGKKLWSRNVATEAGAAVPLWGFSASPLVTDGLVVTYAGGPKGLLAYKAETGEPAWTAEVGIFSYTSPQLATLNGERQVLFLDDRGVAGFDIATGKQKWLHAAPTPNSTRSCQPIAVDGKTVLFSSEVDIGIATFEVSTGTTWSATPKWQTKAMKPAYNDLVVFEGHAYGFDGGNLACVDLATGKKVWRGVGYGHGQLVLLADPKLLVVITEQGEAALVRATPEKHEELGRFEAVAGKTWNHPAVAGGRLYVRNGEEIGCYQIAAAAK